MYYFVDFVKKHENTKTYLSQEFTVLTLYAEYISWLARLPVEKNQKAPTFTLDQILMQLEIINKYQIEVLQKHLDAKAYTQPIKLTPISEELAVKASKTKSFYYPHPIPDSMAATLNSAYAKNSTKTARILHLFFLITLFAITCGTLALMSALPPSLLLVSLFLEPLAHSSLWVSLKSTFCLFSREHTPGHQTPNNLMLTLGAIGSIGLVLTHFFPVPILPIVFYATLFVTFDCVLSKIKHRFIESRIDAQAPLATLDTLETFDKPELNGPLDPVNKPIIDDIQAGNKVDNKLDKAVSATTHAYIASGGHLSRYHFFGNYSVSVDLLDRTLSRRMAVKAG